MKSLIGVPLTHANECAASLISCALEMALGSSQSMALQSHSAKVLAVSGQPV